MDERPAQPPEGKLIDEARRRMDVSERQIAPLAGISYGRWRQIVSGVQTGSKESWAKAHAPAPRLARMARAVGVTPEQLEEVGREDAAAALRDIIAAPPPGSHDGSDNAAVIVLTEALQAFDKKIMASDLPAEEKIRLLEMHHKTGGDKLLDEYRGRMGRRSNG